MGDVSPNAFIKGYAGEVIGGTAGAVEGGLQGLWDLANGRGINRAAQDVRADEASAQKFWASPTTPAGKAGSAVAQSPYNPINWPSVVLSKGGELLGHTAEKLGAPPLLSTALQVAPAAGAFALGLKGTVDEPYEVPAEQAGREPLTLYRGERPGATTGHMNAGAIWTTPSREAAEDYAANQLGPEGKPGTAGPVHTYHVTLNNPYQLTEDKLPEFAKFYAPGEAENEGYIDFEGDMGDRPGLIGLSKTAVENLRKGGYDSVVAHAEAFRPPGEPPSVILLKSPEEMTQPTADMPPAEGNLPPEVQAQRKAILNSVGIENARKSAIEGDAKGAASEYQATKFDEPAGRHMAEQFESERNALDRYTQQMIHDTGGTVGLDEDALVNRGQTIAKPFDDLSSWFDARQRQLYAEAQARSDELAANGNPGAYSQLQGTQALLESPDFANTLMAKDQGGFLNATKAQLARFRQTNPMGFTPAAAEQFRQWLNAVWSHDKSHAIGQIKGALDNDVMQSAGEDLYGQARAMRALKAQTLENPRGIHKLFDVDPQTSINRATPFEKIPTAVNALPIDQFSNLVRTLKEMPEDLQPQAQQALGEIRAQLLNKVLKAGTENRGGKGAALWRGWDVSKVLRDNAGKFRIAFEDHPETLKALENLNSAGKIISVDQSYPGAYAQTANAMKGGIGSAAVRGLGRMGGAAIGAMGGPVTGAAGELLGGAGGEALAGRLTERGALKWAKSRVVSTTP